MARPLNKPKIDPTTGKKRATTAIERQIAKDLKKPAQWKNFEWKFEREHHGLRANIMCIVPASPSACVWGKFYLKHKSAEDSLRHWLELSIKHTKDNKPPRFTTDLQYAEYKNSRSVYTRKPAPWEASDARTMAAKIVGMIERKDKFHHIMLCDPMPGMNSYDGQIVYDFIQEWYGDRQGFWFYPQLTNVPTKPPPIAQHKLAKVQIDMAWANLYALLNSWEWPHPAYDPDFAKDEQLLSHLWGDDEVYRIEP